MGLFNPVSVDVWCCEGIIGKPVVGTARRGFTLWEVIASPEPVS